MADSARHHVVSSEVTGLGKQQTSPVEHRPEEMSDTSTRQPEGKECCPLSHKLLSIAQTRFMPFIMHKKSHL